MTQTSSEFVEHMLDLLRPLGEVSRARFFGGHEIRLGTIQIGMAMGGKFYFRVFQGLRRELEQPGVFLFRTRPERVKSWSHVTSVFHRLTDFLAKERA